MGIPSVAYCQVVSREACKPRFWRDCLAELLATFLYVSTQCAMGTTWGDVSSPGQVAQTALGMAFLVIGIGWAWGDFGGAHMNPAITLALVVRVEITFLRGRVTCCLHEFIP